MDAKNEEGLTDEFEMDGTAGGKEKYKTMRMQTKKVIILCWLRL
jgi:hypothetical protein